MPDSFLDDFLGGIAGEFLRLRLVIVKTVASPAVGTNWSQTVPGGVIWELLGVQCVLATSAVVANRGPVLQVIDGDSNIMARFNPAAVQAASATATHSWWTGLGATNVVSAQMSELPTPPLPLIAQWGVRVSTNNIDAGDQFSAIVLWVREWSEDEMLREGLELYSQLDSLLMPLRTQQGG